MMTDASIHSDLAIPPGEYLEEVIGELGMTKAELAKRMGRPATKLSCIYKGVKAITADTALQLEKVVGVPAHIWLGLESEYRLAQARQREEEQQRRFKAETGFIKTYCYSTLAERGAVKQATNPIEKVLELQKFFGVASLKQVNELKRYAPAFRSGLAGKERSPEAVAAWLRLGELEAANRECGRIDKKRLEESLPRIRRMTVQRPEDFIPVLIELLADVGLALVICPHLPKTYAHGAVFAFGEKMVLMLTIRGRWADIFWFSLFHELGHVLLHGGRDVIVEYDNGGTGTERIEREADEFAADVLIPRQAWHSFVERNENAYYPDVIRAFAAHIGVHAGIVVGRLQHEGLLKPGWCNSLRERYVWQTGRV